MGAPHGGDPVVQGQERVRVRGDVEDREVVRRERPREAGEGEEVEHEQPGRGARGHRHPARVGARRPRERRDREDEGGQEREDEREVAELGDHGRAPGSEAGRRPAAAAAAVAVAVAAVASPARAP